MKTTLGAIIEASSNLQKIAKQSMPIKGAYAVNKNIKILTPEVENFEERRKTIFEKYFKDVDGKMVCEDPEAADKEFGELVGIEVEITPFEMDLNHLESVQIEPANLFSMMWLIKDA